MPDEATLRIAIKNFTIEAQRFKIEDLARILNQSPKIILKILKKMIEEKEIEGVFTQKTGEFVTAERLKSELVRVIKNPSLLNQSM